MPDPFRSLSDDEVRQIGLIIESLERSTFDFLQLELGDIKLTIGKGPPPPTAASASQPSVAPPIVPPPAPGVVSTPPSAAPVARPSASVDKGGKAKGAHDDVAIVAPLLGLFYAQSEPGAPPFVAVGSEVTEATTVGLIEVMKTFYAVRADVAGIISEICVQDAQFVEYGTVLFRVRPRKAVD